MNFMSLTTVIKLKFNLTPFKWIDLYQENGSTFRLSLGDFVTLVSSLSYYQNNFGEMFTSREV